MVNIKIALVTGSCSSIGKTIIFKLLDNNFLPIIHFNKNKTKSDLLLKEIKEKYNIETIAIKCDVTKEDEVKNMFNIISEKFKKLDLVVNNAGVINDNLISNMSLEHWNNVIGVNLTGVFLTSKYAIKLMTQGDIINIASISGETGNIGQSNYSAAKAGVIGLSKTMARELAKQNIKVNVISPGLIQSKILNNIPNKILEKMTKMIPLKKIGSPNDIAKTVLFLIKNDYITGQIIRVNGGLYI